MKGLFYYDTTPCEVRCRPMLWYVPTAVIHSLSLSFYLPLPHSRSRRVIALVSCLYLFVKTDPFWPFIFATQFIYVKYGKNRLKSTITEPDKLQIPDRK